MRDTFQKEIIKLARRNKNLFLLTGDLGFGVFDEFEKLFPSRYINVGVAEQNLIGVSTGLALEGKIIVAYSIANFLTLRCFEQIRNDAVYHNLNINLVSTGGGYTYGVLGMSHHATEDLSVMNSIPGTTIVAPSNRWETKKFLNILLKNSGVSYLRLEKGGSDIEPDKKEIGIGKLIKYCNGRDIAIISIGGIFSECYKAINNLRLKNISPSLYSLPSLKPLNHKQIISEIRKYKHIVTVEENNNIGGLGSTISNLIHMHKIKNLYFHSLSTNDRILKIVGDQDYLRSKVGIDSKGIENSIIKIINDKKYI